MVNKYQNKGIGLLELMLSLAIIAILLIMAVRYYQAANSSQQVNAAGDMFNAVRSAMKNYYNDNANSTFSSTSVSITSLVQGGYLPPSFGTGAGVNPWGGNLSLTSTAGTCSASGSIDPKPGDSWMACMDNVPSGICNQLVSKLQSTMNSDLNEAATCGVTVGQKSIAGGTITATYKYQ